MSDPAPVFERTLVLTDEVDAAQVHALAAAQGWTLGYTGRAGLTEKTIAEWDLPADAELETTVAYREEHYSGYRTLTAVSQSEARVGELAALLAEHLDHASEADVLDRLLDESERAPRAIIRDLREWAAFHYVAPLVGSRPGPLDPRFRRIIERLAAHEHRQVRLTTFLVADQLARLWPECREPVIARKGVEVEFDHLVDAFMQEAAR
jgi:hypothetical protein